MRFDTILIFHSGLGTENIVSQRIYNWKNGDAMEVAAMYNQMKE